MSGLLLLLASCAGSLLVVGLAMRRGRLNRFEGLGVALFIVVVACIGVGGLLSSSLRADLVADGRALVPCAMGPLLALSWRAELMGRIGGPVVGGVATVLLIAGLSAHAATLVPLQWTGVAVTVSLVLAALASGAAAATSWRRARVMPSRLLRARGLTEAAGVATVGVASVVAAVDLQAPLGSPTLWAALVGLGAALATSARAGSSPPTGREAILVLGAAIAAALVAPDNAVGVVVAVASGIVIAHAAVGGPPPSGASLVAGTMRSTSTATSTPTSTATATAASTAQSTAPSTAASTAIAVPLVEALPPIIDDVSLRRPARPRVMARTPARRLVDAAVERAWRVRGRGRPPVDIVGGDDVDVDGDAAELAEALCAVVDAALREQQRGRRDGRITVRVRSAPQTVSFEVDDDSGAVVAAGPAPRPFLDAIDGDGDGDAGGSGVGLARARILVERHGGQLHVRGREGGGVHLTLPRRVSRGPVGLA